MWLGILLVVTGMIMSAAAAIRYIGFIARYRKAADTDPGRGLSLAVVFTVLITVAVSGVIVFLITVIR